jgi:hypothetical protein
MTRASSHINRRTCLQMAAVLATTSTSALSWANEPNATRAWQPFDPLLAVNRSRHPRPENYPRSFEAWQELHQDTTHG